MHAVRQALYEGVLLRQRRQQPRRVPVFGDELRHFRRKFIGKPHDGEKFPLLRRERVKHGGGKHGIDIRAAAGQRAVLRKSAEVQVDGGEPALAGVEQRIDLRLRQRCAAAAGIDGQLRVVEAQLLHSDLMHPPSKAQHLLAGQEAVPARHDEVDVLRQPVRQPAEEAGNACVGQQMEVIEEEVAGLCPRQCVAEVVREQAAAGSVARTGVVPQELQPRVGKGVLHAFPEDGEVVGVDADADDTRVLGGAFAEIPVHRRGLAVAHGRDHRGQRGVRNRAEILPEPLGNVNAVQIVSLFLHAFSSFFSDYTGVFVFTQALSVKKRVVSEKDDPQKCRLFKSSAPDGIPRQSAPPSEIRAKRRLPSEKCSL